MHSNNIGSIFTENGNLDRDTLVVSTVYNQELTLSSYAINKFTAIGGLECVCVLIIGLRKRD